MMMLDDLVPLIRGKRILVIEQDPYYIAIMSTLMRRSQGFPFFEQWGNDLPARMTLLHPLDLILLDQTLPHIDPFKIYETIRRVPQMNKVPLGLLMRGNAAAFMSPDQALERGILGGITKPLTADRLALFFGALLNGQPYWD